MGIINVSSRASLCPSVGTAAAQSGLTEIKSGKSNRYWDVSTGPGGSGSSSSVLLDFVNGVYKGPFGSQNLTDLLQDTRGSATVIDNAAGVWSEIPTNALPITDRGLRVTNQFTNLVSNPRAIGAVAGTPGTLPSGGWVVDIASVPGLTRQIVGIVTTNGLPEFQVRFYGTPTANGSIYVNTSASVGLTTGQAYSYVQGLRLVAGSAAPITNISLRIAGTITNPTKTGIVLTNTTVWSNVVGVAADAARCLVQITLPSGIAVDFTIAMPAPKLVAVDSYLGTQLAPSQFGSGWQTLGASTITLSGGSAVFNTTGSATVATTAAISLATGVYKVKYDITAYTSGSIRASSLAASQYGIYRNAVGSYVDYVSAASATWIGFGTAGAAVLTIANVSIERVYPKYIPGYPIFPPVATVAQSTKLADNIMFVPEDNGYPVKGWTILGLESGFSVLMQINLTQADIGALREIFKLSGNVAQLSAYISEANALVVSAQGNTGAPVSSQFEGVGSIAGVTRLAVTLQGTEVTVACKGFSGFSLSASSKIIGTTLLTLGGSTGSLNSWIQSIELSPPKSKDVITAWVNA